MKKKVRVKLPAGSKGIFKSNKDRQKEDVVLPPAKLRVGQPDPDGTMVLEVIEQDGLDKVMSDMERRAQKASATMTGDERREAGLLIDAIRDVRQEEKQRRGKSTKKSSNALEISRRNESVIREIKAAGGKPFDHFSASKSMMNDISKLDEMYGTNYATDIDDAYDDFTDTVMKILDDIRMPSVSVRETDVEVSKYLKKAVEKKTNEEIIEILEKLAFRLHAGFERFVSIDASMETLFLLAERKKIVRDKSSGSQADIQRDADLTLGISRKTGDEARPISGWMHHSGFRSTEPNNKKKNYKPEFFSMSDRIQILLKPEVFGRTGYSRNAGIFDNAYSVSTMSEDSENIALAILGNINSRNSEARNLELLEIYIEAAITGDYSQLIGHANSPGFKAYILGGINKSEVEVIHYPLSMLDINSVEVPPRDPVVGKDVIALKLKKMKLSDEDAVLFMQGGGPIGGGLNLPAVTVYLQQKAADKVKIELSPLNISEIRFVNPEGVDIFDPYSFQDMTTKLLESGDRIVSQKAIEEVDAALPDAVKKFLKEKDKKK